MNDVFSFEKEVIDNGSDSNLLAIIVLNNFRMELSEAMSVATTIVRHLLAGYEQQAGKILEAIADLPDGEGRQKLFRYMDGIRRCVQACWLWQVETRRYKRVRSIWRETSLSAPARMQGTSEYDIGAGSGA
jgi:hypothetical protein